MNKTLGITLNYNCVSWALTDDQRANPILSMGVRVFPTTINHLGSGINEESQLAVRTKHRNMRRSLVRKKYRKFQLLRVLIANKMCPCSIKSMEYWKTTGIFPQEELASWFASDPYQLRVKALNKKISLHELGRICYHFSQRRGKLFSKISSNDSSDSVFNYGDSKTKRLGLAATLPYCKNDKRLGQHLYQFQHQKHAPYKQKEERIRNRYLDRFMYVKEFHHIYDCQQQYHTSLSESLREELGGQSGSENNGKTGILFYQRNLKFINKWSEKCPYEPNKKGVPLSNPLYEYFEIFKWINNIRCNGSALTEKQRAKVLDVTLRFHQFSFKKVRKALDMEDESIHFNVGSDDRIKLAYVLVNLGKPQIFGPSFFSLSLDEQIDVWHAIYFFDDKELLQKHAMNKWGLSPFQSEKLCKLELKKGYARISAKATRNISYFLELGIPYSQAVFLAAIKRASGESWNKISFQDEVSCIKELLSVFEGNKKHDTSTFIKNLMEGKFKVTSFDTNLFGQYLNANAPKKEYGLQMDHRSDQHILSQFNPIVQKPVFELRKVVNAIQGEYGEVDQIKVYVRPELKASRSARKNHFLSRKKRNSQYQYHHAAVNQAGKNPTHLNVLKHLFWEEANRSCPYTGNPIYLNQLFSEEVSIVHILPWSRFFNDWNTNKTICFTSFKHNILHKTPCEYFTQIDQSTWEKVKTRLLAQFMGSKKFANLNKFKQFTASSNATDVISKEQNDCHHVSKAIKELLLESCSSVQTTLGHTTHSLREKWYLDSFDNFLENEPLSDYRRHGVDALITAVKTTELLKELAKWNRYEQSPSGTFPLPWENFKNDVEYMFYGMPISFSKPKKSFSVSITKSIVNGKKYSQRSDSARGQLHKELFYGKRKSPYSGENNYHIRKSIAQIDTAKHVKKIVDQAVRHRIYDMIDRHGGFENGKVPKEALTYQDEKGVIHSKVTMPNRRGDDVPVHKVRVSETIKNAFQLYDGINKHVNSRNNHHVLIYKDLQGEYKEEVVTFWTAVKRNRKGENVYQLPEDGLKMITSLHINDCFLMGLSDKEFANLDKLSLRYIMEHLYRVQRISTKYYEFRQVYDAAIYDTAFPSYIRILNFGYRKTGWKTFNPKKVHISTLGRIQKYNELLKIKQLQGQS